MSLTASERQVCLLLIVDEIGEGDARIVDLLMSSRHGPSESSVRSELLELAAEGFLEQDESRGIGGTWMLTPAGRAIIERAPDDARSSE